MCNSDCDAVFSTSLIVLSFAGRLSRVAADDDVAAASALPIVIVFLTPCCECAAVWLYPPELSLRSCAADSSLALVFSAAPVTWLSCTLLSSRFNWRNAFRIESCLSRVLFPFRLRCRRPCGPLRCDVLLLLSLFVRSRSLLVDLLDVVGLSGPVSTNTLGAAGEGNGENAGCVASLCFALTASRAAPAGGCDSINCF